MKRHPFPVVVLAGILVVCGCASAPSTAPLPADTGIVPPDSSLPKNIQALSGKWSGKWRGLAGGAQQDTLLVVEKLSTSQATVIYSQGDHPRFRAVHVRTQAELLPDGLTFNIKPNRNTIKYTYILQPDGTLDARMEYQGFNAVATLTRAAPEESSATRRR